MAKNLEREINKELLVLLQSELSIDMLVRYTKTDIDDLKSYLKRNKLYSEPISAFKYLKHRIIHGNKGKFSDGLKSVFEIEDPHNLDYALKIIIMGYFDLGKSYTPREMKMFHSDYAWNNFFDGRKEIKGSVIIRRLKKIKENAHNVGSGAKTYDSLLDLTEEACTSKGYNLYTGLKIRYKDYQKVERKRLRPLDLELMNQTRLG